LIARLARHPLVWLTVWFLVLPLVMTAAKSTVSLATEIVVFTLLAIAYNLLMGYTGLVSFGHSAFFGLGGYAAGLVQIHLVKGMIVPLLAGVAAALVAGAVIGFLLMRKRGVYFSLLTLAFTQLFFYLVYGATALTGGENGLGGIERLPVGVGAWRLDLGDKRVYYYAAAAVAIVAVWILWRVVHSPFGRVLQAIRENEQRASFVGYDVRRYKLTAFVISCAFSGLAGALYTFLLNFAYPESLHVTMAGEIAAMTLVGGMRSFIGPAVGAAVFVFMRDLLSSWTENWLIYFGVIFIAFVMFSPNGIVGVWQRVRAASRRAEAPARAPALAVAPAPAASPATAIVDDGSPFLDIRGLTKSFGGVAAVDAASFTVRRGELRSIIGPNGAGKTTLFNVLTGLLPADGGETRVRGATITGLSAHAIVARGVSRSFQIISVFQSLTVLENVRIAVQAKHPSRFAMIADGEGFADVNDEAARLLAAVGLADRAAVPASNLSHGDQRLLEIAIALGTAPEVLLLDEPLAGLAAHERVRVADLVRALRRSVTIVLIDHDIDHVLALSDRITVLHQGRVIAEGRPEEIQRSPDVQTAYLGHLKIGRMEGAARAGACGPPLLRVEGVDAFYGKSHILHGVSLEIARGEVVALLGRNGAGKTTTLAAITGVVPARRGRITYRDGDITAHSPERIARLGVGLVPQGRRIFPNLTVLENLQIARRGDRGWTLDRVFTAFPKLHQLRDARGATLSGGELQLLAIARALMGNVDLLLLDEPFEGLAPTIVEAVWEVLRQLRGETTLLLVEQNADLALALADRAYVITNGSIAWRGEAGELHADHGLRQQLLGV
jgi:ABC-type branched-subunit amino acid transport system ATPase component/ABC-type branched-subunit amino acid transport system permease subunit